jgi:integrase
MASRGGFKRYPGLQQRGGRWRIRKVIPAELRDLAKQEFGVRNEFLIGLDTDSLEVAKANYHRAMAGVRDKLTTLRDRLKSGQTEAASGPAVTLVDIDACDRAISEWLYSELSAGWQRACSGGIPDVREDFSRHSAWIHERSELAYRLGEISFVHTPKPDERIPGFDAKLVATLGNRGVRIEPNHPALRSLRPAFRDSWLTLLKSELNWANDIAAGRRPERPAAATSDVPTAPPPAPAATAPTPTRPNGRKSFSQLADHYLKAQGINEEDVAIVRRRFIECLGEDRAVGMITAEDVIAYRDLLERQPARTGPGENSKTILELADAYGEEIKAYLLAIKQRRSLEVDSDDDEDDEVETLASGRKVVRPMADQTISKHISTLKMIFQHGLDEKWIDGNPAASIRVKKRGISTAREKFEPQDIKKFFSGPIHTGMKSIKSRSKSGEFVVGNADYWLPILALFSGCRLEEMGQALIDDIKHKDGVWYLAISEFDAKGRRVKRVKSGSAVRNVPLHEAILRSGFLQYVEAARRHGQKRLFPDLNPSKLGDGSIKWTKDYSSKRFRNYRLALGIDGNKSFHSFRHSFKTAIGNALWDRQDAVMGHAKPANAGADYMNREDMDLVMLAEVVGLVAYPEFPTIAKPTHYCFQYQGRANEVKLIPASEESLAA